MGRLARGWRVALLTVVALVGLTVAHRGVRATSDLVYEGQFDVGGTIRLTLSPDHAGITSFSITDVPFSIEGCGSFHAFASAYYDPPLPTVDGAFEVTAGYGDPHGGTGYTVRGNIESGSFVQGVAQASEFRAGGASNASSGELAWSAEGPVTEQPHAGDLRYVGDLGGGQITVFASPDRSQLTGVELDGVRLPCLTNIALNIDATFDPALDLRSPGDYFLGVLTAFIGERRERYYIDIEATIPSPDVAGGNIDDGVGSCDLLSRKVTWTASLVSQATATPSPAAPALPRTGQSQGEGGNRTWLGLLAALAFASGGLAFAGWRRSG